jgi:hypothetical protein
MCRPPCLALFSLLALACAAALAPSRSAAQQTLIGVPSELTTGNLVPGTWQPGDVHVHTDHSHDAGLAHQQYDTPESHDTFVDTQIGEGVLQGLSFVPITDHRIFHQFYDPLLSSANVIVIPGEEWGAGEHASSMGLREELETFGSNLRDTRQATWEAHAQGGVLFQAHPADGSASWVNFSNGPPAKSRTEILASCETDGIEVFRNGAFIAPPTLNTLHHAYWKSRLARGMHDAITGASDNHFRQLHHTRAAGSVGNSPTWVLTSDVSEQGILDGIRAGHTFVSQSPDGPQVILTADPITPGTFTAVMGDVVDPGRETMTLRIRVIGTPGDKVNVYTNAIREHASTDPEELIAVGVLAVADSTFDLVVPGDTAAYYRAIVLAGPDTPPLPQELVDLMKSLPSDDLISGGPATVAAGEENFIAMSSALFVEPGHPIVPAPPALENAMLTASPASETRLSYNLGHSAFPDVARAGGAVHVVWQERRAGRAEVYYRRSPDGGATWEPARRIATGSGDAEMPRVASVGGRVLVVWADSRANRNGRAFDAYALRSDDGGATFSAAAPLSAGIPRLVDANEATTDELRPVQNLRPAVAIDPAYPLDVHVVWMGNQDGAFATWYRRSLDGGLTFAPALRLSTNTAFEGVDLQFPPAPLEKLKQTPAAANPEVAARDGRVVVAWQDDRKDPTPLRIPYPDGWDIVVRASGDRGTSFSPETWVTDNANPVVDQDARRADRNPAVAIDADGRVQLAWQRRPLIAGGTVGIYHARSSDGGSSFSAPVLVSAAGVSQAHNPHLSASSSALHLVWTESTAPDDQFHVSGRESLDFGATWQAPRRVSTSARYGGWAAVASDGARATAVWQDDRDKLLLADGATPAVDRQTNFEIYATALPEPGAGMALVCALPLLAWLARRRDVTPARRPSSLLRYRA